MSNMTQILSYILLYLISYSNISFLLNQKTKNKLPFLIGLLIFPLNIFIPSPIRFLFQIVIWLIIFFLSNKNLKQTTLAVIYYFFIFLFSDIFITTIYLFINKQIKLSFLTEILNYICILFPYILIRQKIFLQFWDLIQKKRKESFSIFLFLIFLLSYLNLSYYYEKINIFIIIILILLLTILLIQKIIEGYYLEKKVKNITSYIKKYEDSIDELRINQHEYKNILATIKVMNPNEETIDFINSILEEKCNKDYELLQDIPRLPILPLRGLLYYKLTFCKEQEIQFLINVDSTLRERHVKQLDTNTIRDITMIFGTLLDNAIEACLETESKNLSIYIYKEEKNLVFQISNTFQGTIHLDFIYKKGYSTKGKGHGYGLALVKQKIKENKRLNIQTEIRHDIFIQTFTVDLN